MAGADVAATELNSIIQQYSQLYQSYAQHYNSLFPYTLDFVQQCQDNNFHVALYTNQSSQQLPISLYGFDLDKRFDYLLTIDDVSNPKPDPE